VSISFENFGFLRVFCGLRVRKLTFAIMGVIVKTTFVSSREIVKWIKF
jgi:hypothetical protein